MKRSFSVLILFFACIILLGQSGNLGLHGKVTWMSETKISVEYDWSDDSQLLDWTATDGSRLVRGDGIVTITGGAADVSSMVWKQAIKCTRIYALDARAVNAQVAHLNFITNVSAWMGYNFNPSGIIGLLYSEAGSHWLDNTGSETLPAPDIKPGNKYSVDINISQTVITARSSSNNMLYSHTLSSPPSSDRQVALGGWGGETAWGKLIIEGEVNISWQSRTDMIDIQSGGPTFSPVIEVAGGAVVEWIFYDGTTSSSPAPVKDYGTIGIRHNLLKVTPWSALIGINAGYDGSDGGYGGFANVPKQDIIGFENLNLASSGLRYICAAYSPLPEIDLSGMTSLRFVEMVLCRNMSEIRLGSHPQLERLCVEDCNLLSLDISGCSALEDLRAASNLYPSITWGTTGSHLWHICTRSIPVMISNLPLLTQFPLLRELLIWDDNQTGPFVCHSTVIESIEANGNHYTSADVQGCTSLRQLSLSGSELTSIDIGSTARLANVQLKDCVLPESYVDYVLNILDSNGLLNGNLDLSGNAAPSASGMTHFNNLRSKGWNVNITQPGQIIPVSGIELSGAGGVTTISTKGGTLQIDAVVRPVIATDRSVTWSVVYGSKLATVDEDGLVKALGNGTVRVRATANDGSGIYGELTIIISNQITGTGEDYTIGRIMVSPHELRIIFNNDFNSWKASLYNLQGKIVSTKLVEGDQIVFEISSLSTGLYLIVLTNGPEVRVEEFVKP